MEGEASNDCRLVVWISANHIRWGSLHICSGDSIFFWPTLYLRGKFRIRIPNQVSPIGGDIGIPLGFL